jgi:Lar family restriction alleviation protein
MTEPKIKPCPFCGNPPNVESTPGHGTLIECLGTNGMDCITVIASFTTKTAAIRAWNRRAEQDA